MDLNKRIEQLDQLLGFKKGIKISKAIRKNANIAILDIKSGRIYTSDSAMENLINVINDIFKGSILGTGYVLIPGSVVIIPMIRKLLNKSRIEKIRRILELSVEKDID